MISNRVTNSAHLMCLCVRACVCVLMTQCIYCIMSLLCNNFLEHLRNEHIGNSEVLVSSYIADVHSALCRFPALLCVAIKQLKSLIFAHVEPLSHALSCKTLIWHRADSGWV